MYCVYITEYSGNKLPRYYVGSSHVKIIEKGYRGSVSSKKWKNIWQSELVENPNLFETKIISTHETRRLALEAEYEFQIMNDVVKSDVWINESFAKINGFFGMNVSGKNNPMYGKNRTGEKHKGGENISRALKKKYDESDWGIKQKEESSKRFLENNPTKNPEVIDKNKQKWKEMERNVGSKNGMYGKKSKLNGKKLYNNGNITKAFYENEQPIGWVKGRHKG